MMKKLHIDRKRSFLGIIVSATVLAAVCFPYLFRMYADAADAAWEQTEESAGESAVTDPVSTGSETLAGVGASAADPGAAQEKTESSEENTAVPESEQQGNAVAPVTMAGAGTEGIYSSEQDPEPSEDAGKGSTSDKDSRLDRQAASWLSSIAKSFGNTQSVSLTDPQDSTKESTLKRAAELGSDAIRTISRNHSISETDYDTLLNIVEAECTGGDEHSKLLVANVILNRVADERFPDTVYDVVWQRDAGGAAQFSPTADGRMGTLTISDSTRNAVNRAVNGEDISRGALFFIAKSSAASANVSWFEQNLEYLYSYGGHDFYRF